MIFLKLLKFNGQNYKIIILNVVFFILKVVNLNIFLLIEMYIIS